MTLRRRQDGLLAAIRDRGVASVRELAATLRVSESTVRRDLARLDRIGEVTRTYGGAVLARNATSDDGTPEVPYAVSDEEHRPYKEAMAAKAAELVPDESVVLLDIGTTTPLVARHLRGRPITVITGNLAVLDQLRADPVVRLVLLGGVVRGNYQTLVGSLTLKALDQISADVMFLSCTGVRRNGHVVDDMAVEAPIKQAMMDAAGQVVLLAHEAKVPGTGSLRLCSLSDVDTLISTAGVDPAIVALCREAGGRVVLA
ncbi:DeoR/GlpR family DNA-binding transcription regulator [Actinocatenispora rupis]|uniref:Lactose phosphotransferase system repressor n=1 Tax=Actinocatenispora rupis TaxID=519421 RepID=A0A8J3J3F5_9ACTN|nr:DeoR/GlpR family DNA-binding transcription regulator [Actinocatenispora rupis]GID09447.1 DeoR family transcriptional regulator [Actinocatenispora rupis]